VHRRGPEAGSFREYDFYGSGMNSIESRLFLQSHSLLTV
jgi:hypothetical protein